MERRYFGTYKGQIVEYYPPYGCDKIVLLKRDGLLGECVELSNITPSPYPWQFHTPEFWARYPGMRWAFWSGVYDAWILCGEGEEKPEYKNGGWCFSGYFERFDGLPMWDGPAAASLFENPFWRNYPAELDDPLWWRDNAPSWATCGSWDFDHSSRPFYFYAAAPRKQRGEIKVKSWSCVGKIWRHVYFDSRYTGTWEDCPLVMRPAAKVPMVNHPKAAPKRAGKPLSVHYVNTAGIVFLVKTEAAQAWLNEQAPMFGTLETNTMSSGKFYLATDTPHAAMRYLVDGFYNRNKQDGVPRTEKRTIVAVYEYVEYVLIFFSFSPSQRHEITRATALDLMQRFDVLYLDDLIDEEITVRIDDDKLVIVED